MGILDVLQERMWAHYGEKWIGKGEDSSKDLLELIRRARKEVKILTGELDPFFYEKEELIEEFKKLKILKIIFSKGASSKEEAIKKLKEENPQLVKLFLEDEKEKISVYWKRERADIHFAVVDSDGIFLEEAHDSYSPRKVLVKYHTKLLGKEWNKQFDKIVKDECEKIDKLEVL